MAIVVRWFRNLLLAVVFVMLVSSVLLTLPLRWFDPPATSFMLQDNSRDRSLKEWRRWDELGEPLLLSVVAAEDQRFDAHFGLDLESIHDSIADAGDGGRMRGASTISQQLAKNLYLWPGRNLLRKGIEAWLAVNLELFLPKHRILEIYLNVVEFGPGIYGAAAASRHFFGKEPGDLSRAEAALLAAVLPSPRRFRADAPSTYVRERQAWILAQMDHLSRQDWLAAIEP